MGLESGVAGTIGAFIADTAVRGIKRRYFGDKSGPMPSNDRVWRDPSNVQQLDSAKISRGKWSTKKERMVKLIDATKTTVLYRHAGIEDLSITTAAPQQNGNYWLPNHIDSGSTPPGVKELPIHLLPLFSVNQGYVPQANNILCGVGHWQLQMRPTNELQWKAIAGVNTDGTTVSTRVELVQNKDVADGQFHYVGRKSLVDWSKVKLTFWGKKSAPSRIRVSLIKFLDDRFTPEASAIATYTTAAPEGTIDIRARQFWLERLKPLMTNPSARHPMNSRTPEFIKILETQVIEINPIDAAAEAAPGDSRAHMRHLTLFNKWNRLVDYSLPVYDNETFDNLNNPYVVLKSRQSGFTGNPRHFEDNVYVMIESFQPSVTQSDDPTRVRSSLNTASFDCLVDVQHTCLSPEYSVAAPQT